MRKTSSTGSEGGFAETMVMEEGEVNEEEEEDEDGPPPGFDCIALQTKTEEAIAEGKDVDKMEEEEEEEEEDDDDGEDEGPPPGWSPIPPALQPNHTPDVEMSEIQEASEDEDDGPPPGWDFVPPTSQGAEAVPADRETGSHQDGARGSDEGTQPGHEAVPPQKVVPPPTTPSQKVLASLPPEKGQMVCGSCRQLLAYPRGVKYVQCSCCQTVNLVLEAHQVGQVKCGGCAVLLMYPEGAPSVKCSSCRYVTDIGAHNRRPPLSVQQARRPFLNPVH